LWEAPVFIERTSVGPDVHALSVAAATIDGVTGEVFRASSNEAGFSTRFASVRQRHSGRNRPSRRSKTSFAHAGARLKG
jgi:hypothetical protein